MSHFIFEYNAFLSRIFPRICAPVPQMNKQVNCTTPEFTTWPWQHSDRVQRETGYGGGGIVVVQQGSRDSERVLHCWSSMTLIDSSWRKADNHVWRGVFFKGRTWLPIQSWLSMNSAGYRPKWLCWCEEGNFHIWLVWLSSFFHHSYSPLEPPTSASVAFTCACSSLLNMAKLCLTTVRMSLFRRMLNLPVEKKKPHGSFICRENMSLNQCVVYSILMVWFCCLHHKPYCSLLLVTLVLVESPFQ